MDPDENDLVASFIPDPYVRYKYQRVLNELSENNIGAWKQWTAKSADEIQPVDPDVVEQL